MMESGFRLASFVMFVSWRRSLAALSLLIISSFTEGISLVMLVPVLHMLKSEQGNTTVDLPLERFGFGQGQVINAHLWQVLLVFVFAIGLSSLINRARTLYMTKLVYDCINSMRLRLFVSVAEARWDFVADKRLSDLDHVLTGDIDRVQISIGNLFTAIQSLVFVVGYIALSAFISPSLTAIACVLGAVTIIVMQPMRRQSTSYGNQLTADRQAQYRIVNDFLVGLKTTKSFAAEATYIRQLQDVLNGMQRRGAAYARVIADTGLVFQIVGAALASVFVYLAYAVLEVDLTAIILLLIIYLRLSPRLTALQSSIQSFAINVSAFEALDRMRASAEAAKERENAQALMATEIDALSVKFRDVGFRRSGDIVLEDISFSMQRGQVTALVGPSGSGKSTIADILMGLLKPTSGDVVIDEIPLASIPAAIWRGKIVAYVPQDVYLLAATLAENLKIASPDADTDALWYSLRQAQADGFVGKLKDGLETKVGDGGIKFSGGETQRLALARALMRKPRILILDEPTSALDATNSTILADTIHRLKKDMAILIITHNSKVADLADQIISVRDGRRENRSSANI